jgi:hypothetical protein
MKITDIRTSLCRRDGTQTETAQPTCTEPGRLSLAMRAGSGGGGWRAMRLAGPLRSKRETGPHSSRSPV